MSASGTSRRRAALVAGVAALALGATALTTPAGARNALRHVPCGDVAASPSFATDRVLFCTAATSDGSGVDLYRSSNAGHTWAGPYPIERFPGYHDDGPLGIWPSPAYGSDHTLYVGTFYGGSYVSTDDGRTFTNELGSTPPSRLDTSAFLDGTPGGVVIRPELVVPHEATIYDPLLPPRQTPPSPGTLVHSYIIPPDYASTHQAVALGASSLDGIVPQQLAPSGADARAYSCSGELVCETALYDFPPLLGDNTTGIDWSGPMSYPSSPDNYAVILSGRKGVIANIRARVYRSTDYGHTWTPWTSVTKLLPAWWNSDQQVYINASPDTPHRLYLHIEKGFGNWPAIPDQQLYRSDDNGATWRRIGYAWGPEQKARSRSTLPWNITPFGYGTTVAEPGGRLYLVGEHDTGKHTDYSGLYCSRDYGAHWSTAC